MVMGKCHELTVDYSHLMGPTAVRLASNGLITVCTQDSSVWLLKSSLHVV